MSRKITTTFHISKEKLDRLRALSKQTGVPVAEYIRQGINFILQTEGG